MSNINYNYIDEFIRKNLKSQNEFLKALETESLENFVPIISPEVGQFLRFLIELKKPKSILEIGTAVGYSSLVMLDESKEIKRLVTMEKNPEMAEIALKNFKKAGEDRVELILGDAYEEMKNLDEKFDFIFIDAAKGQYKKYFDLGKDLLNEDGLVVCDNILFKGMVANDELVHKRVKTIVRRLREFISYVMELEDFQSSLLPLGDGILVSKRLK